MYEQVLIIFAHPQKEKSRVNAKIVQLIKQQSQFKIHDLYDEYPDFYINVSKEQERLKAAKLIVLLHPLYWYSTPAIVKEWQDSVWARGWAYGKQGDQLKGKQFLNIVSTGGPKETYQHNGFNRYTLEEFLRPMEQSVRLCQMIWHTPLIFNGAHTATDGDIEAHAKNVLNHLLSMIP